MPGFKISDKGELKDLTYFELTKGLKKIASLQKKQDLLIQKICINNQKIQNAKRAVSKVRSRYGKLNYNGNGK